MHALQSDEATRKAYDAGPFAAVLRGAAEDRRRKAAAAAARPPLPATAFVDEDVSRDAVEREALAHLAETAPDADAAEAMLRAYALRRLRATYRGVDWDHLDDLVHGPRLRQPSLPRPVGSGRDWQPPLRKRAPKAPAAVPRRRIDYAAMTPLPFFPPRAA